MGLFQGPHVLHDANAKIPWSILGKPLAVDVSKVAKVTNRQTEGMCLDLWMCILIEVLISQINFVHERGKRGE